MTKAVMKFICASCNKKTEKDMLAHSPCVWALHNVQCEECFHKFWFQIKEFKVDVFYEYQELK